MTSLREAAQQALEVIDGMEQNYGNLWQVNASPEELDELCNALREALAEPRDPVAYNGWVLREVLFDNGEPVGHREPTKAEQPAEQEPYTADVTRIMREAGMTFHLGLPHKTVVEQMTRVVDLVYAEASIKAAVAFAAPQPAKPAEQEPVAQRWQPIETAPKGRIVLVYYKNSLGNGRTMRARYYLPETLDSDTTESGWADEGWYEESEAYEYLMPLEHDPTHWMPLPAGPDTAPQPAKQPLTDENHHAFRQGVRYAGNKYEAVRGERFTGGDVSDFLQMEADELDPDDIARAIERAHGIGEQE